ncbi:hypothetical protein [Wolbachia endosymbiont (group B) of Sphaerophoria taeniata]|uniref:hypothetical protein n=1 Tax=Wolbachia endosymbiont (group B) of Sphaerophoria taeniata TaxID=2954058 RepID=UPI00222121E8|nr:hypothetical protein [Wolbachia endosymbiont (group B) of Sphaerophoria taeniata]
MKTIGEIKNKYRSEGLWSAAKEVPMQGWNLVKEDPRKTVFTFVAIAAVASLTAAYFLSPAYATFVGTVGTKAATLVNPAITAMSNFAFAHPLVASLVVLAAVAALITAPVYAYMNSSKAGQLAKLEKNFKDGCEVDSDSESNGWKFKAGTTPLTLLSDITSINLPKTIGQA